MKHFFLSVMILSVIIGVTACKKDNDTKESNTNLKSLVVSSDTLTPAFSPDITDYTVNVAHSVSVITITGEAQDANATVSGNVTDALIDVGYNNFTITVTAQDNSMKKYHVTVIRAGMPVELIQTWKAISVDGKAIVTDNTMILQIKDRENANVMERLIYDTTPVWQTMYSVISYSNDTLKITGSIDKPFMRIVQTYKVLELTNDHLKLKLISEFVNGNIKPDKIGQEIVFEAVPTNVNAKILGMWKTADTYSGDPFGLYFKTTGDYDYYYYEGGTSTIKGDNEGFFWFYGDFMVLRYKNTPNTHDQMEYVECWNVKFVETTDPKTLTFTALREDGKTEIVSFRFIGIF